MRSIVPNECETVDDLRKESLLANETSEAIERALMHEKMRILPLAGSHTAW